MHLAIKSAAARKPRKLETHLRSALIKIVQLSPDCQVCGQRMDAKFLAPFPGAPEVKACPHCIADYAGDKP